MFIRVDKIARKVSAPIGVGPNSKKDRVLASRQAAPSWKFMG